MAARRASSSSSVSAITVVSFLLRDEVTFFTGNAFRTASFTWLSHMPHIMPSTWTVYFHIVYPSTVFKIQFAVSSICSSLNDFRITAGILLEDASGNALPYPSLSPNQHPRLSQHH